MTCELLHGDLFKSECQALVNTVNCVGVMGAGIALQFKRRYTKNFMLYRDACYLKKLRPGKMLITQRIETENDPTRWIINFPTKDHWKDPSRLSWVHDGLGDLVAQMNRLKIASVAIPPLGCGHGKLHWLDVKTAIEAACEPWPWHAKIYEPEA